MTRDDQPFQPDDRPHDETRVGPVDAISDCVRQAEDAVRRLAHPTSAGHPKSRPTGPIHVPEEWRDHDLLTFEQFCDLIHTPARTVRDWRRRRIGPHWTKLEGTGRLYITVAQVRRFLHATTTTTARSSNATTKPQEQTA